MKPIDLTEYTGTGVSGLAEVLSRLDEPCSRCSHAIRCAAEEMACQAFRQWVSDGSIKDTATYLPSKKIYAEVFKKFD